MKERPILLIPPMVRAILTGAKTQTRRVVKPEGAHHLFPFLDLPGNPTGEWAWCSGSHLVSKHIRCPYGQPGDRLWVREKHAPQGDCWGAFERLLKGENVRQNELTIHYAADYAHDERPFIDRWRPSIHMPRRASRITLEITGVRVERLGDISRDDAEAEGVGLRRVSENDHRWIDYTDKDGYRTVGDPRQSFWRLWKSINGDTSNDANPLVWVIEFRRVQP